VSPIFVRPVREQLEHDRLIRHLQSKLKRKYEVEANVGDEQQASIKVGANTFYPDLVLTSGRKVAGVIEVETGESVNNLEAMAQWVHFAKARVPFSLYVPVQVYDTARRLCEAHGAKVSEIWTYRGALEGFDLIRMFHDTHAVAASARASRAEAAATGGRTAKAPRPAKAARTAKTARKTKAAAPKRTAKKAASRPASRATASRKAAASTPRSRTVKSGARKK